MFGGAQTKEAGDSPASPVAALLPLTCNVSDEVLFGNVEKTIKRGVPLIQACEPHERIAVLVGGGPSAEDGIGIIRDLYEKGADIFALNGAGLWLQGHGIAAHALILLDARAHNAKFVRNLWPQITLYIASQCDPAVFEAARWHKVIAWHPPLGRGFGDDRQTVMIGGSTTTGMRAMRLVHVLGYRAVHLFGYDSSYRDGDAHSYDQFENATDVPRRCVCGNRAFVSTAWMIRQADDFRHIAFGLIAEGLNIHVHGDGLLPQVARQMQIGHVDLPAE